METSSSKVVVAVDDTVDNVDLVKRIVKPLGYSFHGCTDGRALLPLLAQIQPDLILLDVEMPELNGFDLCKSLRQRPETARTPVLFVTGRNSHDDVQRAIALGGNDFVVKPYDPIKLRARIVHWIQRAASLEAGAPPKTAPASAAPAKPLPMRASPAEAAHPSALKDIIRRPDASASTPPAGAPQRR